MYSVTNQRYVIAPESQYVVESLIHIHLRAKIIIGRDTAITALQ